MAEISEDILQSSVKTQPQSKLIDPKCETERETNMKKLGNKEVDYVLSNDKKNYEANDSNDSNDRNHHFIHANSNSKKNLSTGTNITHKKNDWENASSNVLLQLPSDSSIVSLFVPCLIIHHGVLLSYKN